MGRGGGGETCGRTDLPGSVIAQDVVVMRAHQRRYLAIAQDRRARPEEVAEAVAAMQAEGMLRTPQDYTFALKSLGRKQLCRMCYGPPPNVYHFNAAISACESSGYWEGVGTLLQQMTYFGVPPDVVQGSFGWLAIAVADTKVPYSNALALREFQHCHQCLRTPETLAGYGAAIDACARAGRLEDALALLEVSLQLQERMQHTGLHPDVRSFASAFGALGRSGRETEDQACRAEALGALGWREESLRRRPAPISASQVEERQKPITP
ncbi:hypothetical protein AK812_SmicGene43963 [Symbiodinium microadriaticum]|uniref:Pentatricopeptide repeat-containing protein, chloroplastic n=1 Tax=Symbiodinium microadriaticum TaxID=2951 RepID=A0A1Q9BZP3_SYMMI|nr:hypothetical protein AK812_SmicGene43963 [Symbiodinium microadriaticum]